MEFNEHERTNLPDFQSELRRIQLQLRDFGKEVGFEEIYEPAERDFGHEILPEESLRIENNELKQQIERLKAEMEQILKTRSTSRICQQKLNEAESQAFLYKQQTDELRKLLSAEQNASRYRDPEAYFARVNVLEDRVKEVQHENFELRRQLAGLTPERIGGHRFVSSSSLQTCEKCLEISKQKAQQAKYFETKLIQSRNLANDYRNECQKLNEKIKILQNQFIASETRYKDMLEKQTDIVSIYKHRSERLEKHNVAQLKGLDSDMDSIKAKLANIEKALIKTQLTLVGENVQTGLLEELRTLTSESKVLSEQVKRLRLKSHS